MALISQTRTVLVSEAIATSSRRLGGETVAHAPRPFINVIADGVNDVQQQSSIKLRSIELECQPLFLSLSTGAQST